MAFRFQDEEGNERIKKGLHPVSGKPIEKRHKALEKAKGGKKVPKEYQGRPKNIGMHPFMTEESGHIHPSRIKH